MRLQTKKSRSDILKIRKKQERLRDLDGKYETADHDLDVAIAAEKRSRGNDCYLDNHGGKRMTSSYYSRVSEQNTCRQKVEGLRREIEEQERKPSNVSFHLPREKHLALQWLFFMYMPREWVLLATLAHRGQSRLWNEVPHAKIGMQNLHEWFRGKKPVSMSLHLVDPIVLETPVALRSMQTPGIRQYGEETGVFFPDDYSLRPRWKATDPFTTGRDESDTTKLFTEFLPCGVDGSAFMQQFMPMLPRSTRGNKRISRREKKTDWLTQEVGDHPVA